MSAALTLDVTTALVVHPATELFPPVITGPAFDALAEDIAAHGLRRPIVRTLRGAILDGRARAVACRITGVTPKYCVHGGDPYRFVIKANDHRFTCNNHRAVLGGLVLCDHASHLTGRQVQELTRVSSMGSLMRGKAVARTGTPQLIALTAAGRVPLTTAARIAGLAIDAQNTFCARIEAGRTARIVGRPGWTGDEDTPLDPTQLSKREARYRYVQESALQVIANSFDGLSIVLDSANGLDPAISPEQAAHWRSDLSRQSKSFRRLMALLKERGALGSRSIANDVNDGDRNNPSG